MKLSLTILIALLFAWQQAMADTPQADRQNSNVSERGKNLPLGFTQPPGWSVVRRLSEKEWERLTCPPDLEHAAANDPGDWVMNRSDDSINAEKKLAPKLSFPVCSEDGNYVSFVKNHYMVRPPNPPYELYALNRRTLKLQLLHRSNTLVSINSFQPLSPHERYLIGPPDVPRTVTLPDGPEVKVISVSAHIPDKAYAHEDAVWARDDSRLVMLDVAQVADHVFAHAITVVDPSTGTEVSNRIEFPPDCVARDLHLDGNRVYVKVDQWFPSGDVNFEVHEYMLDGLKITGHRLLFREPSTTDQISLGDGGVMLIRRYHEAKKATSGSRKAPAATQATQITYLHYPDGHEDPIFVKAVHPDDLRSLEAFEGFKGCQFTQSTKYVVCDPTKKTKETALLILKRDGDAAQVGRGQ